MLHRFLLATLTVDPLHDFVERIAMDRIAQPGFRRREHVTILIDAEFVLVRPRSGRSPRLTPADCAAACGGSASTEATAAVAAAEAPKNCRRDCFRSDIARSYPFSSGDVMPSIDCIYGPRQQCEESRSEEHTS